MYSKLDFDTSSLHIKGEEGFLIGYNYDYLIYFPLRQTIVEVTEDAFQILKQNQADSLVRAEIEEQLFSIASQNPFFEIEDIPTIDKENNVLGLALTTACNLRCIYCHAEAGTTNKFIDNDVIDASIEEVFQWCKQNDQGFYLIFTGSGEPTLNWKALTLAVEKAKEICFNDNVPLHISMASNGVYGDVKRRYILQNFSRITLSIDGTPDIHDASRFNSRGEGSFKTAFETARFLFNSAFPIRLRSTISAEHAHRMLEIYEFLQSQLPGIKISFEPLNPIGRGTGLEQTPTDDEFAAGYLSILRKYGGKNISYSAIPSIHKLRKNFCSPVARPNVNISVDGELHACSRANSGSDFIFGEYDKGSKKFIYDRDKINHLSSINVNSFPDCQECFAKYHCAGDCHDLRQNGYFRCGTNRSILYQLIKEQLNTQQ